MSFLRFGSSNSSNYYSSAAKKRKANDGRATDVETNPSGLLASWRSYFSWRHQEDATTPVCPSTHEQLLNASLCQMERMEKIMGKMESRCKQLEAKCESLEAMLETTTTKEHFDTKMYSLQKTLKYHMKNQSWQYSAPVHSEDYWLDSGYNADMAVYLEDAAQSLKDKTVMMRKTGEFPDSHRESSDTNSVGICISTSGQHIQVDENIQNELAPHWREFTAALLQLKPTIDLLSHDQIFLSFSGIQLNLNSDMFYFTKNALLQTPFKKFTFSDNEFTGDGMRAMVDLVVQSTQLEQLFITHNSIANDRIPALCAAVRNHPSLHTLEIYKCFEDGLGDVMLSCLLAGELKLKTLNLPENCITSNVSRILSDFLASNPVLEMLDLGGNKLNDKAARLIATALRSNTRLTVLDLDNNKLDYDGFKALKEALHGASSTLNAVADANHTCIVTDLGPHYSGEANDAPSEWNKAQKIYELLSQRHRRRRNVKHFDKIDVKLLPDMIVAVQRYADILEEEPEGPSSIVFEVLREWNKVFPLYELGGTGQ
jgi:hypothetical protein